MNSPEFYNVYLLILGPAPLPKSIWKLFHCISCYNYIYCAEPTCMHASWQMI